MINNKVMTVTQLNNYVKKTLENDIYLLSLVVEGEISNFKMHTSGHLYFTLKDSGSRINAVMFSSAARSVKFPIKDGDKVILRCRLGVYETAGTYQLYVNSIEKVGLGNLYVEFERLKKRLQEEGVFDAKYKKPIKKYPTNIAIISASTGAAIHDMMTTAKRRWPIAKLTLYPSLVQGVDASRDIVKNINLASTRGHDLIIVARGGGSLEDLWPFNEEIVARAIIASPLPVVSGVGHEVDYSISDFAASLRAPTPTAAIEMVTPSLEDVISTLMNCNQRLFNSMVNIKENLKAKLEALSGRYVLNNPLAYLESKMVYLDKLTSRLKNLESSLINENLNAIKMYRYKLDQNMIKVLNDRKNKENVLSSRLKSVSPLSVIDRGYSITSTLDGVIVKSISDVEVDSLIKVKVKDGSINAKVIETEGI